MKNLTTTAQALHEAVDTARGMRGHAGKEEDFQYWLGYATALNEVIKYMKSDDDDRSVFSSIMTENDVEAVLKTQLALPSYLRPQAE